ncbi:hypothetical protein SGLAM104S_06469 [Streptomyces glaucescens]
MHAPLLRGGPHTAVGPSSGQRKGRLITVVSAYADGYAGSSTGFSGSPPFFSQPSSLAMASEKEWATVA